MTVKIFTETAQSRQTVVDLRAGSTKVDYVAVLVPPYSVSDDADLLAYAQANTPLRNGFQQRRSIELDCQGSAPAQSVWYVHVTYGFDEGDAVDLTGLIPGFGNANLLSGEYTVDTSGGTVHITQSLATRSSTKYGNPATPRTVNDAVFSGNTTVTSATINFTNNDVGALVLSSGDRTVNDASISTTFPNQLTSATAAFASSDVGAALTSAVPGLLAPGTRIETVLSATEVIISPQALQGGSAENVTIAPTLPLLNAGTTIQSVQSATSATLSKPALYSVNGTSLTLGLIQPPNFNRAIGVSKDGVAGCDKIAPKVEFQIVRDFVGINIYYIALLKALTGTVNASPWQAGQFNTGEVLFLGASFAPSQNNQATAAPLQRGTFKFALSENKANVDITGDANVRGTGDAVTNEGSTTLTSASAKFTAPADVGASIGSPNSDAIPPGTTIASVVNATTVTLSAPAEATTGSLTITIASGGKLVVPFIGGWDHVWVAYVADTDPVSGRLISRPDAAYVEIIYESNPFDLLGIGG